MFVSKKEISFIKDEVAELATRFVNSTSKNVFLTGKAGSGKTTFLKNFVEQTPKKVLVAAPTGIAAINAGGITLHSLLGLPFGIFVPTDEFVPENLTREITTPKMAKEKAFQLSKAKVSMLNELDLLIIDEVSMLRADLLDCIDQVLKTVRKRNKPFGGLQMLFIGDLFQLPPVVKQNERNLLYRFYSSFYFFDALILKNRFPIYLELDKIFRQTNQDFIQILNRLRNNNLTSEDVKILEKKHIKNFDFSKHFGSVFITTHNKKADTFNERELNKLSSRSVYFEAEVHGIFHKKTTLLLQSYI